MAEIKIEKKKPWWPWILALLIILAVVAYFLFYSDEKLIDDDVSIESEEAIGNQVQEGFNATNVDPAHTKSDLETTEYTSFIGDRSKLGTDVEYTKDALVQLSNAVRQAAVEHGIETDGRLERVENSAKNIQKDGDSLLLAQQIKNVGGEIAQIIGALQEKEYPELAEASEKIKRAVGSIVPNQQIDEQKEQINVFFDACGDALKEMNPKKEE